MDTANMKFDHMAEKIIYDEERPKDSGAHCNRLRYVVTNLTSRMQRVILCVIIIGLIRNEEYGIATLFLAPMFIVWAIAATLLMCIIAVQHVGHPMHNMAGIMLTSALIEIILCVIVLSNLFGKTCDWKMVQFSYIAHLVVSSIDHLIRSMPIMCDIYSDGCCI